MLEVQANKEAVSSFIVLMDFNYFFLLPIPVRLTRGNVYCFKWHELLLVMTLWIKSFEPGPGVDSMAIALTHWHA